MTVNQLWQVLRTYTTHRYCWAALLLWPMLHMSLWGPRSRRLVPPSEQLLDVIQRPLSTCVGLGLVVAWLVKLQFANPRARMLPGFSAAHLVVAGAIVGAGVAIEAVLIPAWVGVGGQMALISLTLLTTVAAAWIAYWMSPSVGFFLIVALMFAPILGPRYVVGLIEALSDRPITSLAVAGVGLVAMAALGVRLWRLSEEMPEYSRQIPDRWDFTSRAGNRNRRRWEAREISRYGNRSALCDVVFRLVLRGNGAMGPLRRLMCRQLAGGFSSLFAMILVFVFTLCLLCFLSWSQKPVDVAEAFFLSYFPQQMVLVMLVGMWLQRGPFLARESLWPLNRRDFVRDLARLMACNMAPIAGVLCAMIVVWLKLFSPPGRLSGLLLPWLALTVAQYVVAYCVMFWLVSFRRFFVLLFGSLGVSVLLAASVTAALFADAGFWSPVNVATVIIVTALGVALLYRLAFRRWCQVDLD